MNMIQCLKKSELSNHKRRQGGNLNVLLSEEKANYDSNSKTIWRRQNYGDSRMISAGWGQV